MRWLEGRLGLVVRALGLALTLASLLIVGSQIVDASGTLGAEFSNPIFVTALLFGILGYALLCALIGFAWTLLARGFEGSGCLGFRDGMIIFGRSQILKYLPSNVLHLVGRHGMARAIGASHSSLLLATAAESALLVTAGAAMALVFALPLLVRFVVAPISQSVTSLSIIVALGALGITAFLWLKYKGYLDAKHVWFVGVAVLLYTCFFLLNGAILYALLLAADGLVLQPWLIVGVTASAWLGGFVVPGAPAGLGIREMILLSGLELAGSAGPSALAAAIGYRIVTFGGDVVVALVSLAMSRPVRKPVEAGRPPSSRY